METVVHLFPVHHPITISQLVEITMFVMNSKQVLILL